AFVYFEDSDYDVYTLANPRAIAAERGVVVAGAGAGAAPAGARPAPPVPGVVTPTVAAAPPPQVLAGGTVYRGAQGFRPAGQLGAVADSALGLP
ncbi:MAG: hypothetical protein KJZ47_13825, partial [Gemmatimonadales bacterium]|nr:hypothetical protein [Gemmatimonadales bacterium]